MNTHGGGIVGTPQSEEASVHGAGGISPPPRNRVATSSDQSSPTRNASPSPPWVVHDPPEAEESGKDKRPRKHARSITSKQEKSELEMLIETALTRSNDPSLRDAVITKPFSKEELKAKRKQYLMPGATTRTKTTRHGGTRRSQAVDVLDPLVNKTIDLLIKTHDLGFIGENDRDQPAQCLLQLLRIQETIDDKCKRHSGQDSEQEIAQLFLAVESTVAGLSAMVDLPNCNTRRRHREQYDLTGSGDSEPMPAPPGAGSRRPVIHVKKEKD